MTIVYATPCAVGGGPSADSGFRSIGDVITALGGGYTRRAANLVIYDGVVFSYLLFRIDTPANNTYIEQP